MVWVGAVSIAVLDVIILVTVPRPAPDTTVISILLVWALAPSLYFWLAWKSVRDDLQGRGTRYSREADLPELE